MSKIPLMDYIGRPLLACMFLALLLLQWRFPLRRQHFSMLHRLIRNFVLSIPGFAIVRLAMLPIPLAVAMWARERHIGLLNWLPLPGWAAVIATFLLMDYAYWWWHWGNHMIPIFWRFHNVHHTDLDLDVTTAARFHFGEMIFSIGFLSLAVTIFGITPLMLVVFFITFEVCTLFHHSNWRLPIKLERILNLIETTQLTSPGFASRAKEEGRRCVQCRCHRRRHRRVGHGRRHGRTRWTRRAGRAQLNGWRLPELRLRPKQGTHFLRAVDPANP